MSVAPRVKERYFLLRSQGFTITGAAREVGISRNCASGWENKPHNGQDYKAIRAEQKIVSPIAFDRLCKEAVRGWEDFEFFRWFYLGHVSTPWQIETAEVLVNLQATGSKEYVVENCPPGVGKTTLIHDLACWLTVRDRRLRGLIGSRTETNARRMLSRVKRSLERPLPAKAPTELIEKGLAVDAKASLAQHYGLFKPAVKGDIWRADEFIVAQFDDIPIEEKEPTWSSYGLDSGVLSNRFNLIFWDDLIDSRTNRTGESREILLAKWDEELENRLEPGGLLAVLGQRLHPEDLYSTLRNRQQVDDEGAPAGPMYHHIVYPAHDETICQEIHNPVKHEGKGPPKPWPDGCLLDPYRLPWSECRKLQTKRHIWPIVYQQTDGDPSECFVHPAWITGGTGPDGSEHPGCWDDRDTGEIPRMQGRSLSIATCDPSPTKYWAVQWWIVHLASQQRFLIDQERKTMDAPDFFDHNPLTNEPYGLMVDWQERSVHLGHPITHWIVERNAAQRFMLQQTALKQYASQNSFNVIPHETTYNKSDKDLGVQSVRDHYRYGRVRLPGRNPGRARALHLVDELLKYPGPTDDCVMAHWFLEWNLPKLVAPDRTNMPRPKRPSWFTRERVA